MRVTDVLIGVGCVVLVWCQTATVRAQPAEGVAALKAALEGRQVTMSIDMPASHGGIDVYPQREPDIDAEAYGLRLKEFGTALPRGTRAPITLIKVNTKNIEIHLAGGGYGTRNDPVVVPRVAYIPKSARELDLEKERDRTRDPARKKEIERQLLSLSMDRSRDTMAENRRIELEEAIKKAEIARKRLERGSRINVWYPDKRLEQWVPSPADLMQVLARYVDFSDPRLASLRKGMTTADVYAVLGFPSRRRPGTQGDYATSIDTWETRREVIEVTFVDGLAVDITSTQK
ncbi:hypothetical protein TBR22_A51700 [Luteitalea sp. TBR-22]|uniref:enkurin domain-containing protein n=1 Tax=Luteitalea sp. TBR-22 TaxID=2802971 RepID=UPI001AF9AFD7|nr:enkurin domain-containing protein [Luteitalea sp. TBR-22]BCS35935.1 hypothetical protein TBR22_A51700 [Luteitalea sp. TBR-22]